MNDSLTHSQKKKEEGEGEGEGEGEKGPQQYSQTEGGVSTHNNIESNNQGKGEDKG